MKDPQPILPATLKALMNHCSDPRRLGGIERAFGIAGRRLGQAIRTFEVARALFAAMLEEDAIALIAELERLMPDLTQNTIAAVLALLPRAT